MHLLFNMLALWMFGCDLERRWGSEFFLKYYLCVGGRRRDSQHAVFAGTDGAEHRRVGGHIRHSPRLGLIYPNQIIYFYFLFPIKMKYFVMIIGAIALYSAAASGQSGIAHLAHLGGMVFGYLYLRGGNRLSRWKFYNPWDRWKLYQDRRRLARLKRRFQVLPGGKDDDSGPTMH